MQVFDRRRTLVNPARRRRRNPRNMSLRQKLHFGTKRQRVAAAAALRRKRRAQPAARRKTNTTRRRRNIAAGFYDEDGVFHPIRASYDYSRRRAGEKPKRRRATTRRRRRRNPGQLISLGVLPNPTRRKKSMAKRRRSTKPRRRRTSNPVATRRYRRRNYSPRRRRRRNPVGTSRIGGLVQMATYTIAGAAGTRAATQVLLGPRNQGAMGYLANGAAALILGQIAQRMFNKKAGQFVTVGGFVGIVLRAIEEYTNVGQYVNLQLGRVGMAGLGDRAFAGVRGLGHFEPMDFFTPLASADQSGASAAAKTPDMINRSVTAGVRAALPAGNGNGMSGLGRSRYTGSRVWGQ